MIRPTFKLTLLLAVLPLTLAAAAGPTESRAAYEARIVQFRADQTTDLTKEQGWLSVAGLFWLSEGTAKVGSGSTCAVLLPGSAPAEVGAFERKAGKVTFTVTDGVPVTVDGKPVTAVEMRADADGSPTKAKIGSLTMIVIKRGARIGIRLYDANCKARAEFTGEKWFDIDPNYRIKAKFVAYKKPKMIPIVNVLGDTRMAASPGYAEFTVGGRRCRLIAEQESKGLFFNFRDATTGKTTYAAGRFLDAPNPEDGYVTLDFNEATNPPCAFTDYATCPLPPKGNHLAVAIPAGEKAYRATTD